MFSRRRVHGVVEFVEPARGRVLILGSRLGRCQTLRRFGKQKVCITDCAVPACSPHRGNRRCLSCPYFRQVLVFPPFSARNRFLVHTLVQNFFHQLNTISIGSSFGRRIVVHHSSLTPM